MSMTRGSKKFMQVESFISVKQCNSCVYLLQSIIIFYARRSHLFMCTIIYKSLTYYDIVHVFTISITIETVSVNSSSCMITF